MSCCRLRMRCGMYSVVTPPLCIPARGMRSLSATVGTNSVLVLDDEPHARQRRILLPPLKGERMRSFIDAMLASTRWEIEQWRIGETRSMIGPMQRITLRVMLQVVLGLESSAELADMAARVQRVLELGRGRHGLVLVKLLPLELLQRTRWLPFFRRQRELDLALASLIDARRRQPAADRRDSILADLLAATHADGRPLTDPEIRDALVTLIFAGHDTTSVALAWALEQIIQSPEAQERIDQELHCVTGGIPPRADQLGELDYLEAAIRESLRIRTILPFVVRLTKIPFHAGGRDYPAGVVLCPCNHLVHHNADLYPEPDVFRPQRFLGNRYAAHEWFPFGGGNRTCLGMSFALYEMKVVLSALLATIRLARPDGRQSYPVRRGIVLAPHDGMRMTLAERRS